MHRQTGQRVAVLVDEYDKPIVDALELAGPHPAPVIGGVHQARLRGPAAEEVARANRNYLRGLYAVIKDCDAHVRFCFLDEQPG